jgi:hypothetical protein
LTRRQLLQASWAPVAVLVLHAIAGKLFGHEPYVDPASHLLGGAAAAYFFRSVCAASPGRMGSPSGLALDLLALGMTVLVAYVWELGEFLIDRFSGSNIQWGVAILVRDLTLGTLGGIACLLLARVVRYISK